MKKTHSHLQTYFRDFYFNILIASPLVPRPLRWSILRISGLQIEKSAICARVWIGSKRLQIKKGSFINYGVRIDNDGGLTIGHNCDIGPGVAFFTTDHSIGNASRRAGTPLRRPIIVHDGVWIGARATILPGVTIGEGSVIGAGSLVTKDCEPNSLYFGAPAKKIRDLKPLGTS